MWELIRRGREGAGNVCVGPQNWEIFIRLIFSSSWASLAISKVPFEMFDTLLLRPECSKCQTRKVFAKVITVFIDSGHHV